MTNYSRLLRETYRAYLEGRTDFDEVKRVTDEAAQEYERERGRLSGEDRQRREA